jgi:Asp-tRNA(Asn)/Glu-tRNA(Gln) amidotransferase A subunit family amidase
MTSALALVDASLAAIADHGARTNAFIVVDAEGARAAARVADDEKRRGLDRGPLHGMPISIKDLIDVAGQPTTAGSNVRPARDHIASHDALIVQRLRDAGAILIGKTNLHEFALGPTSDESSYGAVRNPFDVTRSAGGSSGGSAAAVALGIGAASIGTDTGGSIRIPAAACGIVGLKPSLGEVPTDGVIPLSMTLDHPGPLTRSVVDAANIWAVLAGRPVPQLSAPTARELRLGALGGYFTALLSPEVRASFDVAVARLRSAGVFIAPRAIDDAGSIVETYVNISLPEAAAWHTQYMETRSADYQPGVRDRLERGRTIPAVSYLRALETRVALRHAVDAALEQCDALILPTLPIVAPLLADSEVTFDVDDANGSTRPETLPVRAAMLRLTQLFNISGHPAITLPIPTDGLPIGLQVVGRRDQTVSLLDIALACERLLAGNGIGGVSARR